MDGNSGTKAFELRKENETIEFSTDGFIFIDHDDMIDLLPLDTPMMFNGICIGICRDGFSSIQIGYKEYELVPGRLLVLPYRQILYAHSRDREFSMDLLFIPSCFLEELLTQSELDLFRLIYEYPCLTPAADCLEDVSDLYAVAYRIANERGTLDLYKSAVTRDLVLSVIHLVASEYSRQGEELRFGISGISSRGEDLSYRFFFLLSENYTKFREVSFYADKLCITPKYLSSVIRKTTNRSASEWIKLTVLTDIKQKLKKTDISISELSEMMHFSSPSAFSRYFRSHFGVTPLEYRNGA